MLSENPDKNGDQLVSIPRKTMLEMASRLNGFHNLDIVLQGKDAEIKKLRQTVIDLRSKLLEFQKSMSVPPQQQAEADNHPSATLLHRSSAPDIFVYPDMSKTASVKNHESLLSRGTGTKLKDDDKIYRLQHEVHEVDHQSNLKLIGRNYGESLHMDVLGQNEFRSAVGGVSEVVFNNVVSELVKTKQYLYNLEQKQRKEKVVPTEKTEVNDSLTQELKQLRQRNEQLQHENVLLKMGNQEPKTGEKKCLNDSFELDQQKTETADKNTQTVTTKELQVISPEIQRLKSDVVRLMREKDELLKERQSWKQSQKTTEYQSLLSENNTLQKQQQQTTVLYNQLKESVKILSTCLHEEKERYKQLDVKFKDKTMESSKLLDRIAHMRQKYEELRQEKNALEKTLSLSDWNREHSHFYSSTTSNSTTHNRHIRQPSNESGSSTDSAYAIAPARIQPETETDIGYECPGCLQNFKVEKEYHIHLSKCCVD